jgi:tRNA 2-(methylsulfanyl)-N6-isopentenyladenosine37 hydroxylase
VLDLRVPTPAAWLDAVFADFDAFLVDHAACERKAFSTGVSLISSYPKERALVTAMLEFSREELEHFQRLHGILVARGLDLAPHEPDHYARALGSKVRRDGKEKLCDRLLVSGIIEARSCERLKLMADALETRDPELAPTYADLARAEARHHGLFFRLCRDQVGQAHAAARAAELLDFEAELVKTLPLRARVH